MEKEIHNKYREEHPCESHIFLIQSYGEYSHEYNKYYSSKKSTFYKLLDIPTLWNILNVELFYLCSIFFLEILYIPICGSFRSEPHSVWMHDGSVDSDHHALSMSLRRSIPFDDRLNIPSILEKHTSYQQYSNNREPYNLT